MKIKTLKTNFEKYGHEIYLCSKEGKEKSKQTNLKKYGKEYYSQTDEYLEKIKITNLKKYSVDNIFKNVKYIKKFKDKKDKKLKLKNINNYKNKIKDEFFNIIDYKSNIFMIYHKKCKNIFEITIKQLYDRLKYNNNINICTIRIIFNFIKS